ncbi:urea ABC transporter permease subunit UrtB [Psychromonas sp. 14N.309.X.WAT.B.A12]|uniref:urea ABC transporter permease subunit UrtB n=1 Tax=Psychromonas sp. 14N.309.X.WAT.B.A12 TaxID=2998322 RepID=UPI0025AFF8A1|nr:urea ABC transporter permease subunit UrtB [Psychromonas sp. 14N.309.X.WAT.B.A12]MDN2663388.1 urea ABC transporter permease subunit UrtB [Psychromonas sp. 14N.309.X.WAT.B.A12]
MLRLFPFLFFFVLSLPVFAAEDDVQGESELISLVGQLPSTKLNKLSSLIEQIADTSAPQVRAILEPLMAGDLYYLKANKQVVSVSEDTNNQYQLIDVLSNEALPTVSKSAIKKVRTNNRLRGQIRDLLANLDLTSDQVDVRISALKLLLDKPNKAAITAVNKLIKTEQDSEARDLMSAILLVEQLENGNDAEKLSAAKQLSNRLEPSVKNALVSQLQKIPGSQQGGSLKAELSNAIDDIEQQISVFKLVENLFFGLSLGSVLLLAAIGLAITFGVMGVINMAHGEMMMLGAYTTYVIQQTFPSLIEYSLLMAVPAAFLVSGFVGILIERGVIRFLKGRPLETLLATFGISLILQQLVRTVFSPLNRQVEAPLWMSGSLEINPVLSITYNRLYIIIFSLMVFFSLLMILKRSSLGLHVRAVSQNRDMARALSVKSSWVDAITFGLGSGIAGVAGVALSQLTNVGPNLGQAYIIDSFLVVVFGGVGNLWGTLVAAMTMGTFNKILEPSMGPVLANIIVLVSLVLFIQKRPKGLFPQKGRAAE